MKIYGDLALQAWTSSEPTIGKGEKGRTEEKGEREEGKSTETRAFPPLPIAFTSSSFFSLPVLIPNAYSKGSSLARFAP